MQEDWVREELEELQKRNLYRKLRTISSPASSRVILDGKEVVNFSSNNYLGLASRKDVVELTQKGLELFGAGSSASRLIAGNFSIHEEAEEVLARFKGKEASLIFSTGYMANLSLLTSLSDENTEIFSDQLNHASIIDGCRLSKASISVYRHRDLDHLEHLVKRSRKKRKIVITDGVFSMDGDIAPLGGIADICERYGCIFIVDDAHGTGVLGEKGRGTTFYKGVNDRVDIIMGTLGKAMGLFGAFVASSKAIRELLINKARPFIYTTSLPPSIAYATKGVISIIERSDDLRKELHEKASFVREGIKKLGFSTLDSETQIIPVVVGDERKTMELSKGLLERGFFAHGIRPPTVPNGTSRLRVSIMADHRWEDLEGFLEALRDVSKQLGIP